MDFIPLESIKYYRECAPLVEGLGYVLVDLKISVSGGRGHTQKISAVISSKNPAQDIGIDDCAKVHHALLPRLEALLGTDDTYMELTSPGLERNIKNAAEFSIFIGRMVRVWDKTVSDWVQGEIVLSDEKSIALKNNEEQKVVLYENIAKAKLIQ